MHRFFLFSILLLTGQFVQAQVKVNGKIIDQEMQTELPFATIRIDNKRTVQGDYDGSFSFELTQFAQVQLSISYMGYFALDTTIDLNTIKAGNPIILGLKSKAKEIKKAVIKSELAKPRKTPIAYSNINQRKISEIQSSQDMVMALNTMPGVYATEQGGGSGDARISIRGFNQRNIAVMVDGIPVNDMENGQVYWSNWFGISAVSKVTQVQRGLGASKIANPSIGGSINMITMEVGSRPRVSFKQEYGTANYLKSSLTASTGMYKNKIGAIFSTTYRRSDGWVDGLNDNMQSYFLKIDYRVNAKNRIVLSGFAAPQEHGQRSFRAILGTYDTIFAQKHGMDTAYPLQPRNMGRRYNRHWGYYNPGTTIENMDTVLGIQTRWAERRNQFNKPQFYIKYTRYFNPKLTWTNTLYASFGRGAGYRFSKTPTYDNNFQYDFQRAYLLNSYGNSFVSPIDPFYSSTLKKNSEGFMQASFNNHNWYGGLSVLNYEKDNFNLTTGLDIRMYKGRHYQEIGFLLGSDYAIQTGNFANPRRESPMYFEGDRFNYDNTGIINWQGGFIDLEYSKDKLSAVVSTSGSVSSYQYQNHFEFDTSHFNQTGNFKDLKSEVKVFPTINIKGGLSYNLNKRLQIYGNLGHLQRAPRFSNVFDFNGNEMLNPKKEFVNAAELGAKYSSPRLTFNFNLYHTRWLNKPLDRTPSYTDADGNRFSYNINGLKALHTGIELEGIYVLHKKYLDLELAAAFGDWIWNSGANVVVLDENSNQAIDANGNAVQFNFSAKGVHVGDAAQHSFTAQLKIKPVKGMYIRPALSYFGKHYADFEPASLQLDYQDRESFQLPSYAFINLHLGKYFKLKKWSKGRATLRAYCSIINLTDAFYITDGQHRLQNGFGSISVANAFNPKNVEVFVSQGRRITFGLSLNL